MSRPVARLSINPPEDTNPLRVFLVDRRVELAQAAAAAAVQAHADAGNRAVVLPESPKWTESPKLTAQWGRLDTIQRIVHSNLDAGRVAAGRDTLPVSVEFPQTYDETVRFCRPEGLGLRSTLRSLRPSEGSERRGLFHPDRSGICTQGPGPGAAGDFHHWCQSQSDFSFVPPADQRQGMSLGQWTHSPPIGSHAAPQLLAAGGSSVSASGEGGGVDPGGDAMGHVGDGASCGSTEGSEFAGSTDWEPRRRAELMRTCWNRSRALLRQSFANLADAECPPHLRPR